MDGENFLHESSIIKIYYFRLQTRMHPEHFEWGNIKEEDLPLYTN